MTPYLQGFFLCESAVDKDNSREVPLCRFGYKTNKLTSEGFHIRTSQCGKVTQFSVYEEVISVSALYNTGTF